MLTSLKWRQLRHSRPGPKAHRVQLHWHRDLPRIPAGVRVRAEQYLVRSSYITSCEGGFASVPPRAGLMGPASPAGPVDGGRVCRASPLV